MYCVYCGNKGIAIPRRNGRYKEPGHLKKLYCVHCKTETNHVEIRPFCSDYNYEDFKLEKECINIVNYHNILLNTFPNRFYNRFLGIEELKYKVGFTSDKTEGVFSSGIENI